MNRLLIVGASSGVGRSLANDLSKTHELWTASRRSSTGSEAHHVTWDALSGEFPSDWLPEELDGMVYCPGSIRLSLSAGSMMARSERTSNSICSVPFVHSGRHFRR